jgi:hypothetical protein
MYVFSRSGRLSGDNQREAMAWAVSAQEKAVQITGLQVSLYSRVFSAELGTIVYAVFVPDLPTLEAAMDKLMADNSWHDMLQAGQKYIIPGTVDDRLSQVVHPAEVDQNRHIEYVALVRSTIVQGHMARGGAAGVEIAQRVEKITGVPVTFLSEATGNYGEVSWAVPYSDIAEMERFNQTLYGEQSFISFIDSLGGVFASEGGTTQVVMRRVV